MGKTLVFGASLKIERYSNMAIHRLREYNHEVIAVGLREGTVLDVTIQKGTPQLQDIDTITLYMNPERQQPFYDYLIGLKPRRIIFNPGTENADFVTLLRKQNIQTTYACTLVLLSTGQY